ncbi:hypothetical protein [Nocardioides euryhalodurans]|uniref:Heavy-metal-associated domain-containing protein n=1 Tax=Nocardioides euryhalodurans TaxID=2518370 RepID=A0A4P7GP93_9ACTN|nr:hypothetical protein [Nocardioides euryhalodurans]QBR93601.1 hypothetical protein EXE57_15960 [Nocardioides euryhalodurans]
MVRTLGLALALLLALPACTSDASDEPAGGHSHGPGGAMVSLPVGDGTTSGEVGYALRDVRLPDRAGTTGEVGFRIEGAEGEPVTQFLEEQTRDLHLYVVREDLGVFRHLHPTMAVDGTWTAPVVLPGRGDYRVVAEFVAEDAGGNGDHVVLGESVPVAAGPTVEADPVDPLVDVAVTRSPRAGANGRMQLTVSDTEGRPVRLDTYLGAYGHVTGFHTGTGSMLHLHPMSAPEVTEDGATLTFHSEIEFAGDYVLFVQVRVDGYLHRVPVEVSVAA